MSSIKLTANTGGGTFEIKAPASSSNTRSYTLPDVADTTMAHLNGISVFDTYHLSASITADADPITSNLVRNAFTGNAAEIGGGVTNSSGTFSFPSTGKYLVIVNAQFNLNGSDSISLDTKITVNNSSYAAIARAIDGNNGTGVRQGNGMSIAFIDVTDVTQVKVNFAVGSIGTGSSVVGNNVFATTSFTFAKIGET
jgi:hypothetical protein